MKGRRTIVLKRQMGLRYPGKPLKCPAPSLIAFSFCTVVSKARQVWCWLIPFEDFLSHNHRIVIANLPLLSLSCVPVGYWAPWQYIFSVHFVPTPKFTTPMLSGSLSDCSVASLGKVRCGICEEPLGEMKLQLDCVERELECQRKLSKSDCSWTK